MSPLQLTEEALNPNNEHQLVPQPSGSGLVPGPGAIEEQKNNSLYFCLIYYLKLNYDLFISFNPLIVLQVEVWLQKTEQKHVFFPRKKIFTSWT